jgi:hypothetical protein
MKIKITDKTIYISDVYCIVNGRQSLLEITKSPEQKVLVHDNVIIGYVGFWRTFLSWITFRKPKYPMGIKINDIKGDHT